MVGSSRHGMVYVILKSNSMRRHCPMSSYEVRGPLLQYQQVLRVANCKLPVQYDSMQRSPQVLRVANCKLPVQ